MNGENINKLKQNALFKTIDGVPVIVLSAESFGGEFKKNGIFYCGIMILASLWSFVGNVTRALCRKALRERDKTLKAILWEMGRDSRHYSCFFGDRTSKFNHMAKVKAASWKLLDSFYNYHQDVLPQLKRDFEGFFTKFWMGRLVNRQAVTNRKKILVKILLDAFARFADQPEIRLLSVASGSVQVVIEAMQACPHLNIRAALIDRDKTAIEAFREKSRRAGLEERFNFICDSTDVLESIASNFSPHIVEMVGFLDYRPTDRAVQLIKRIHSVLPSDRIFITSNINYNCEKPFVDWVLLWPMIYRNEKEFLKILTLGGFNRESIQILYEPLRIHAIAVCIK